MKLNKLTHGSGGNEVVVWPNCFKREQTTGPQRLAIAASGNALDLMGKLAEAFGPEYYLLYVHSVARSDASPGRYQSPLLQHVDIQIFMAEFDGLLRNDARHGFWIGSANETGMLVYDEHGLIYAYGPLAEFERILQSFGVVAGEFSIPCPHMHHFHSEYDDQVGELLTRWDWHRTELRPEDER